MTLDAPIQINLSQDNSWDQIDDSRLTQDDKNLLKEHFNEESEGILYLTKQEIQELKATIDATRDPRWNAWGQQVLGESFSAFIERQKTQWLVISDFLVTPENIPAGLEGFFENYINSWEELMREQLFWGEGMLSSLNISPMAQDRMSVSMGLSFMNYATRELLVKIEDGDLSPEDIQDVVKISESLEAKFASMKAVIDSVIPVPGSTSATMSQVYVAGNGEENSIFMDPVEWVEFFNKFISWDLDATNIQSTLQEANGAVDEDQEIDFWVVGASINTTMWEMMKQLETLTPEQLQALDASLNSLGQAWVDSNGTQSNESDDSSKKGMLERFFEMIQEFVAGFIDLWEEAGIISSDDDAKTAEQLEEIAPTRVDTIRTSLLSRLSQGGFSGIQDAGIKTFLETEWNTEEFLAIMRDIPTNHGQDTLEEKINNMLFSNIESEETDKFTAFIKAWSLESIRNADGSFNGENFLRATTSYKNYRLAHNTDSSLTFEAFFINSDE